MDTAGSISDTDAWAGPAPALYYLRTFQVVARLRSFSRAAEALDLSQPAVSGQMRALERYYGARLFQIRHKRPYLTAEGEALHGYVERVFRLLRDADQAVAAVRGLERGRLDVAASATIGIYMLPRRLGEFARLHGGIDIQLFVGTTAEVTNRVLAERVPLGLVEAPVSHPELDVRSLAEDQMVLVVPRRHHWAGAASIDPGDLAGVPFLRRESDSGTRALVDRALEDAGVEMATAMVLASTEALKQAVLAGVGAAWVPRITVERELAARQLVAVEVRGLDIRRTLSVISVRGQQLPPAAAAFLDLLRS